MVVHLLVAIFWIACQPTFAQEPGSFQRRTSVDLALQKVQDDQHTLLTAMRHDGCDGKPIWAMAGYCMELRILLRAPLDTLHTLNERLLPDRPDDALMSRAEAIVRESSIRAQLVKRGSQLQDLCPDQRCIEEVSALWSSLLTPCEAGDWAFGPAHQVDRDTALRILAIEQAVLAVLSGLHRACLQ